MNKYAIYLLIVIASISLIPSSLVNSLPSVKAQTCGYEDSNPDSYEVDELCEELGYDSDCFTSSGELKDRCADKLEEKGSKEYENYKKHQHDYDYNKKYSKKCDPEPDNYKKCGFSDKLDIFVYHGHHPLAYYNDGVISVNNIHMKFNVGDWAAKTPAEKNMYFDYYFLGDVPYDSKVCIKNLDSGNRNCVEVYKEADEAYLRMPS